MIKLISIARTFHKKENHAFKKYIHLHYHQDAKAHEVADWLMDFKTFNQIEDISLDELYQLSPQPVRKQTFKNLISELGNHAEEYIAWKNWQGNAHFKNTNALIALGERNLNNLYRLTQKKLFARIENGPLNIFDEYFKTVALFYDYNFQISTSKDNYSTLFKELIHTFKTGISKVAQSLLVEIKNRERLLATENWNEEKEVFDVLYETQTDIVHIMTQLLLLNNEDDVEAYEKLIRILKGPESQHLSHFLRYSILIYCTVFLHGVFKTGDHDKLEELLELYEYGLENKILTPNESIDTRTYLNVISVFSKLSNSEKTLDIINKYTDKVDYADTKVIRQIAISTLDINKGRYEKVIKELRTIEPSGFHLKFKTRWLQLKSMVEVQSDYPEVITAQISIFKRYITSNKNQINKPTYDGLISTLNILTMIIGKKPTSQIHQSLENSRTIFEKKWVMDLLDRSGIKLQLQHT